MLTIVETLAVGVAGDEARMNASERALIGASLPEVLKKLTPEVTARVEVVTYPLMLGVGGLFYALRVYGLVEARAKLARAQKSRPLPPAPQQPDPASSENVQLGAEADLSPVPRDIVPDSPDARALFAQNKHALSVAP